MNRFKYNSMNFCFEGEINNKRCIFRINTGSDISILNNNLMGSDEFRIKINNCNLTYPAGEKVTIGYKMYTTVRLGNYLVDIPILVAKVCDDCIFGVDFFEKINLGNIFEFIFFIVGKKQRKMIFNIIE